MVAKKFRSANFAGVYLRIDGHGVTQPTDSGGGIVNAQFGAESQETQEVTTLPDGTVTIGSTVTAHVVLRVDGSGVTRPTDAGGGVVNCQFNAGPYERFRLTPQPNGSVAIASVAFPGVYVRLDASGINQPLKHGGGTVNCQFGAGPDEQFIVESADSAPSADYLEYFFLRNKGAGGMVIGFAPTGTKASPQPMLVHRRGPQLFKCAPVAANVAYTLIVNQSTQLALQADAGGVRFAPPDPANSAQHWAFTAKDQLTNATTGAKVLSVQGGALAFADPSDDPAQKFESFYPADFVYVRHCRTGRFLTVAADNSVSWQMMGAGWEDFQQWGVTSDGLLVSRLTGKVLQSPSTPPAPNARFTVGDAAPLGPGNAHQRFNVTALDGAIHCHADAGFVIGKADSLAVSVPYSAGDATQLLEFISPFQFFSLQNQVSYGGAGFNYRPWCQRDGVNLGWSADNRGDDSQLFTVSRYGEIISATDGFVLASRGANQTPGFFDPAFLRIGDDQSTFTYDQTRATDPGTGAITLRSGAFGLIAVANPNRFISYSPLQYPVHGNQAWALIGPSDSLFSAYQDLARAFFSDPAPLPSATAAPTGPAKAAAAEDQPNKTVRVVLAIVTGLLGLVGISVGSVSWAAANRVGAVVLGEASVAAAVAVIMQSGVTAASVIAVADGITKAGLWLKIAKMLLPNSYWGWALLAAKLVVTLASFATGVGWAIKGAQVGLIVGDVALILASD